MSAAEVRSMQAQGVREIIVKRAPGVSAAQQAAIRAQAGVAYAGPGHSPTPSSIARRRGSCPRR